MAKVPLEIENNFVTATSAGKQFGYTKEYLLLLIKDGKIEGKKIGNKWYMHAPSAETYFQRAEENRIAQRKAMSLTRKQELQNHLQIHTQEKKFQRMAVLETAVIVIMGLSLGVTGFVGTTSDVASLSQSGAEYSALEKIAISLYTLISPPDTVVVTRIAEPVVEFLEDESQGSKGASAVSALAISDALIVAPADVFSTSSLPAIQDSFSDEVVVSVDPENESTGIITPIFKNTESESYRFLMVPVERTQ